MSTSSNKEMIPKVHIGEKYKKGVIILSIMILSDKGLDNLRYAIIKQAVVNYQKSLKILRDPTKIGSSKYINAKYLKQECENFFLSPYFGTICDLDGERIIKEVRSKFYNRPLRFLDEEK